jgi:hypothetical protein
MTFLELYGDAIDTELGTADRTQRFTTARRKLEINAAQKEFNRLTNCYVRRATITPLVSGTGEYNLLTAITALDFIRLAGSDQLPVLKRTISATVDYITGMKDFPRRSTDWLDNFEPGWRSADPATPTSWYTRQDAGTLLIGLSPAPLIAVGDVWQLLVPYVANPDVMTGDAVVPFSTGADVQISLLYYHQALAHFAAGKLELLRKAYNASDLQMKKFAGYVAEYLEGQRVDGPQHVVLARDYLGEANRHRRGLDLGDPRR